MKIGFIGAGVVGSGFGKYLRTKGIKVSGYYDLNNSASMEAAATTGGDVFENFGELLRTSDIVFITTHDDGIQNMCEALVAERDFKSSHIVAHMSGANSCELLESASKLGAEVFALHPLQTFPSKAESLKLFKSIYFGLEYEGEEPVQLTYLMESIGNPYFRLKSDQKARYHIAAVAVSNYLTTLIEFGLSQLEKIGIDSTQGFDALLPLINGALKNISKNGTESALTGPIARGDEETVAKHMRTLEDDPDALKLYVALAQETLKLAQKDKLKDELKILGIKKLVE